MGVPYETKPHSGLLVRGGETAVFAIEFPSRSWINKIVVQQYDGVLENFVVELFNHGSVMTSHGKSQSDSIGPERGIVPQACYLIGPPLASSSPGTLALFISTTAGGPGLGFFSQDDFEPGREGVRGHKIYVRITVGGTGDKHFCLVLGGDQRD